MQKNDRKRKTREEEGGKAWEIKGPQARSAGEGKKSIEGRGNTSLDDAGKTAWPAKGKARGGNEDFW